MTRSTQVVVPAGWSDPARPSGGNRFDLRVCAGLTELGWDVAVHELAGPWPLPDPVALAGLAVCLDQLPARTTVLLDGLIGSAAAEVLVPRADRLRLVLLVHLPLGDAVADRLRADVEVSEHEVLESAAAVITTSRWTRRRLLDHYGLWPGRVYVAEPGADPAPPAAPSPGGDRLVCVAAVVPHKGHDILLSALGRLADLDWRLRCVGPLDRDLAFVASLRVQAAALGIADRVDLLGAQDEAALSDTYAAADLLVVPSRTEAYGMVVAEAQARAIPVLASDVGGLPEAIGRTPDGERAGLLVPPDDAAALAVALGQWLSEPDLRALLGQRVSDRRTMLRPWSATAERIASVLEEVGG